MAISSISSEAVPQQSPGATDAATSTNNLEAVRRELAALRQTHQDLQETLAEERRLLESVREERDEYRRILYPALWAKIPMEELIHFSETCHLDADCTLEDTLRELEIMDREYKQ